MSSSISRIATLAALAVFGGAGLMQAAEHATFHLPVAAHWGKAILQPGDYKMYVPDASTGDRQFLVKGAGKSVYEMPLVTSTQDASLSSHLTLREVDGTYFVREFSSGPTGETFTFATPNPGRHQELAKGVDHSLIVYGN